MTKTITHREWEALSAYLDGQLSPKDSGRLEARLRDDADLRAALDEMRRTRIVLRSAPRLRAPRNFTLTPEMAGIRTGRRVMPRAYPVLRMASVLAAVFFMVVFVGDLLVSSRSGAPLTIAQNQQVEVAQPGVGPGMGGGEDKSFVPDQTIEVAKEVEPVFEAEAAVEAPEAEAPMKLEEAVQGADEETVRKSTPLSALGTASPTPADVSLAVPAEDSLEFDVSVPQEGAPAELPVLEVYPAPVVNEPIDGGEGVSLLRVLQALLVLLAVGTGLAALYLRRSASS